MKTYHLLLTTLTCTLSVSFFSLYPEKQKVSPQKRSAHLAFHDNDEDLYQNSFDIPISITTDSPTEHKDAETIDDTNENESTISREVAITIEPADIISLLLDSKVLPLLQEDFFKKTNRTNTQSLLDYPHLGNQLYNSTTKQITGCDIFFNQTSKGYFTKNSPALSSYLNLTGETLINRIECCLESVEGLFSSKIDAAKILGLFKNIALQQRRLGGMFYHVHRHTKFISRFKIPFYYLENNLFLTNSERIAVATEFGDTTQKEQAEFRKNYFVSDKVGFGDCRFILEYPLLVESDLHANIGGYITLPTAFAVKKGMLGSSFAKPKTIPPLTIFETLFDLALDPSLATAQEEAFNIVKNLLLDSFNRAASNLLDTPLGNGGHVGLGLFAHSCIPMSTFIKRQGATQVHMVSRLSAEYLFPSREKLFYIHKNKLKDIDLDTFKPDTHTPDPAKAAADLKFIEQELIHRFFLAAYNTRVKPGIIFHGNNTFRYQGRRWGWDIGTDTWIQTKDTLSTITIPSCPNVLSLADIDKKKSEPFFAYRGKVCGGINYCVTNPTNKLNISLNLDTTLFNSGIGKDFVLFFKIECHH